MGGAAASVRDLRLLQFIGEQCAVAQPQLARIAGVGEEAVRKFRRNWERAGWTRACVVASGRPPIVWLTGRGHRVASVWFRPWRPTRPHHVNHIVAAAEVRLYVSARRPTARWICERELLRRDLAAGLGRERHRPDALVQTEGGTAAVEVELTLKSRERLERIALELHSRYDAVWYFAPRELIPQLDERLRSYGLAQQIQLVELPDPWRRA